MSRVKLGRVTGAIDVPRGPDVSHRIRVPADWLTEGATIQVELPRNLVCAACKGGGCDKCGRSGAISVSERKEPLVVVEITLPKRHDASIEQTASGRSVVIRIPNRGGVSDSPDLPRGLLLLAVSAADVADPGVRRAEPPPPVVTEAEAAIAPAPPVPQPAPPARKRAVVLWVAIVVIVWIALLIFLRLTGRA